MSMEILFLCHRLPYPPNKGDKIRSHALFRHLAREHIVHLGCFIDDPADFEHMQTLRDMTRGQCFFSPISSVARYSRSLSALLRGQPLTTGVFHSPKIEHWINRVSRDRRLDCAVVFGSAMAPFVLKGETIDPRRVVFDMVDIDSDKWRQYASSASWWRRWIYAREARTLLALEQEAARNFAATTLVSDFEAKSFVALVPDARERILAHTNGVDLDFFAPGEFTNPYRADEVPIVMTGQMDYYPNADAAEWFAQDVLPLLKGTLPAARFYIVGSKPTKRTQSLSGDNVVVTGRVPDIRSYLQHAAAVVAPLRIARGLQNKVLEALAMRKPVVATYEATRALNVTSGSELWVARDPQTFADAVVMAATDPSREHVAERGRQYVQTHHRWQSQLVAFDKIVASVVSAAERDRTGTQGDPQERYVRPPISPFGETASSRVSS